MSLTISYDSTAVPLTLSDTKPDFYSIVLQMQLYLQAKETWNDLLISSVGETIIELVAAAATFNQFGIESAVREAYLTTAIRASSIYALTRTLGVRITRKYPAGTDVVLTRTSSPTAAYAMPAFTQMNVDGRLFFNRDPIYFPAGSATANPVRLYEGTVKKVTYFADSSVFKEIVVADPDFIVSDIDVDVKVVNTSTGVSEQWTRTDDGIWSAGPYDAFYNDSTDGFGNLVLAFGDGYHGKLPPIGNNIVVSYATTTGALGNTGTSGLEVTVPTLPNIRGVTTSNVSGGANEKPASYYKVLAPQLYKARTRAVTNPDYGAIALSYPSASSVQVKSQRDIAPGDLRWMNVVRMCILPQDAEQYTPSEWVDFIKWFRIRYHAAIEIQTYNPTRIPVTVGGTLYLLPTATPDQCIPEAEGRIRALFAKNYDSLGKRIAISDLHEACDIVGVDYFDLDIPVADFITPDPYSWFDIAAVTLGANYSERAQ